MAQNRMMSFMDDCVRSSGVFWVQVRMHSSKKMGSSGIQLCHENGNNLKLVENHRYLPIYSTITMVPRTLSLRYLPLFPVSVGGTVIWLCSLTPGGLSYTLIKSY